MTQHPLNVYVVEFEVGEGELKLAVAPQKGTVCRVNCMSEAQTQLFTLFCICVREARAVLTFSPAL